MCCCPKSEAAGAHLEPRSRRSVSSPGVLSQQGTAVPLHCSLSLPSANMLCIHTCHSLSHSTARTKQGTALDKHLSGGFHVLFINVLLQKSFPIRQGSGARVEGCIHVSYLLPLHKGRSQREDAKVGWILSFSVKWTITYLQRKC